MARTRPLRRERDTAVGGGGRRENGKKKQRRRKRRRQQNDWSDLPNPALFSVLQRLTNFRDHFAFDGVCRAWRAVSQPVLADLLSSQPPLLCGSGGHHFYSFSQNRFYRNTLPALCRKAATVLGSSQGYLIMGKAGSRRELWLVNPFTGDEVTSVPRVPFTHSVEWAVLTAPPSTPGCVLMAWCSLSIVYWRPGDPDWSMYWCETQEERACTRWPIVLDGVVYARNLNGKLLRFEFVPRLRVNHVGVRVLLPGTMNAWLVASGGEILAIHAMTEEVFAVYRLNHSIGGWGRVETLGERALLFTPIGSALADDRPARWGGEGNCIYYHWPPRREVKVFRLEERKAETLPVGGITLPRSHVEHRCCCLGRCCSSFVWVLPSLCY